MFCIIKEFGDFPSLWPFVSEGGVLILRSVARSICGNIFLLFCKCDCYVEDHWRQQYQIWFPFPCIF